MPPKRSRQQRESYHFYCLCSTKMRYQTSQRLSNHINKKHGSLREINNRRYKAHLDELSRTYLYLHPRLVQNGPNLFLRDIDIEQSDIKKMEIIDKTLMYFLAEQLYDKYSNKRDVYSAEQILEQGFTKKDLQMITQYEPDLHQAYKLEQLRQIFSKFEQYAPMRHGEKGELIDMKKEMAQNFSLEWEPKIRLQIDLSTLRIKNIPITEKLYMQILNCEEQMWKQDRQKIVRIINNYAQEVVINHQSLITNSS